MYRQIEIIKEILQTPDVVFWPKASTAFLSQMRHDGVLPTATAYGRIQQYNTRPVPVQSRRAFITPLSRWLLRTRSPSQPSALRHRGQRNLRLLASAWWWEALDGLPTSAGRWRARVLARRPLVPRSEAFGPRRSSSTARLVRWLVLIRLSINR